MNYYRMTLLEFINYTMYFLKHKRMPLQKFYKFVWKASPFLHLRFICSQKMFHVARVKYRLRYDTAYNTLILPNFLVWKFCEKAPFSHSFGQFTRNSAETDFPQNFHTRKLGKITAFYALWAMLRILDVTVTHYGEEGILLCKCNTHK